MIRFIKENSHIISKLMLYQFGAAVLGFTMSSAVFKNHSLLLAVSIFASLFYLILVYLAMWEEGGNERIKIDGGRAEMKPVKGLLISLCANIPNFVLGVLMVVGYIFGSKSGPFGFTWAGSIYAIVNILSKFWEAMYLGLVQLYSPHNPIAWILIVLPALAVSFAAYTIGINNKRLLVFVKKKK